MSFQGKLVYLLVKNRHLFSFRLKPEIWDESTSVPAFRSSAESSSRKMANKLPSGLVVEPFILMGMRAEWLLPSGVGKAPVILYLVGGG